MANETVCAICWDLFRKPKCLPCRHTFCLPCLKKYLKENRYEQSITCPLCRAETEVPSDGLESLFDNYYVVLRENEIVEMVKCDICGQTTEESNKCRHCLQHVCFNCKPSHRLAVELSGETFPEDSHEVDNEADDEDEECEPISIRDEPSLPFHLMFSSTIRSNYNVVLDSFFGVSTSPHRPATLSQLNISSMMTGEKDTVLLAVNNEALIILCNNRGDLLARRHFELISKISSLTRATNGNILICATFENCIFEFSSDNLNRFANTGGYSPLSVSTFVDGRVAVTGKSQDQRSKDRRTVQQSRSIGALLIIDKEGKLLKEIVHGQEGNIFVHPGDVAVSPINDTIVVSDQGKRFVFIFHEDGSLLKTYRSHARPFLLFMHDHDEGADFLPLGLCFDSAGYLFLINGADSTIHILHPDGDFLGYALTRDDVGFGQPVSIAMSADDKIWLGDSLDGTVRVYKISSYKNSFREL